MRQKRCASRGRGARTLARDRGVPDVGQARVLEVRELVVAVGARVQAVQQHVEPEIGRHAYAPVEIANKGLTHAFGINNPVAVGIG